MKRHLAFTLVELFVIIVVIAILAAVSYMGYGSWQRSFADRAVQHDLLEASGGLERYKNSNNYYPSNLAGTGFAASPIVAMKFKTNSQQVPYYTSLTPDENAQLLLNSCNSYMPTVANGTTYNTACSFAGNNFHIQGTQSTNVLLQGPTIQQSEFVLTCGAVCDAAQASIVSVFGTQVSHYFYRQNTGAGPVSCRPRPSLPVMHEDCVMLRGILYYRGGSTSFFDMYLYSG